LKLELVYVALPLAPVAGVRQTVAAAHVGVVEGPVVTWMVHSGSVDPTQVIEPDPPPLSGTKETLLAGLVVPPIIVRLLKAPTTVAIGFAVIVTLRASSRAPFVIDTYVKSSREKSIKANTTSKNSGITTANSMIDCPR